jgi:hypothetical protein
VYPLAPSTATLYCGAAAPLLVPTVGACKLGFRSLCQPWIYSKGIAFAARLMGFFYFLAHRRTSTDRNTESTEGKQREASRSRQLHQELKLSTTKEACDIVIKLLKYYYIGWTLIFDPHN